MSIIYSISNHLTESLSNVAKNSLTTAGNFLGRVTKSLPQLIDNPKLIVLIAVVAFATTFIFSCLYSCLYSLMTYTDKEHEEFVKEKMASYEAFKKKYKV